MKLLDSFVQKISLLDDNELEEWISDGLAAYHDHKSERHGRSELAFKWASLSFGRDGYYSTAVGDLTMLYAALGAAKKNKFSRAVGRSIDLLTLIDNGSCEVLRDLIELALEIRSAHAVDSLARKLCVLDPQARSKICLESAFFLSESHAATEVLRLAQTILDKVDFPYEISAQLLIALCTYDLDNSTSYATAIRSKLEQQLVVLRSHHEQFEKFRSDFAEALLRAPNESEIISQLLRQPVYAGLLEGKLQRLNRENNVIETAGPIWLAPDPSFSIMRQWHVVWEDICSFARNYLRPGKRGLHVQNTLDVIERAIG